MTVTSTIPDFTYARLSEVKAGDTLVADGGFTCIEAGARLTIEASPEGLCVPCTQGIHCLDGQLDTDGDTLIGFARA